MGDAGGFRTHIGASPELCLSQAYAICVLYSRSIKPISYVSRVLISYGQLSSVLWSGAIAFTLHMAFLNRREAFSGTYINNFICYYVAVCFGLPAVLTVLPYFFGEANASESGLDLGAYGDTGGWCWIKPQNPVWRLIQFYIILWTVVSYNFYVYIGVHRFESCF
jgi:hypothetical protein